MFFVWSYVRTSQVCALGPSVVNAALLISCHSFPMASPKVVDALPLTGGRLVALKSLVRHVTEQRALFASAPPTPPGSNQFYPNLYCAVSMCPCAVPHVFMGPYARVHMSHVKLPHVCCAIVLTPSCSCSMKWSPTK